MQDKVFQRVIAENQPKCSRCQLPKKNGFYSLTIYISSKYLEILMNILSYLIEIKDVRSHQILKLYLLIVISYLVYLFIAFSQWKKFIP